jgi:diacylglycerol kinase (ATP)
MDVCLVSEISRLELLALLPKLRAGTHLDDPAVLYERVPELDVEPESSISVNADGEQVEGDSFRYRISPHRVRVMLPR